MGKKLFIASLVILATTSLCFAEWSNGYTRKDGTYVSGHYRSDSDSTVQNNYSYKGNYNPYTGNTGSNYYRHSRSSQYYEGY